jgi:hypothetical protein
MTIIAGLIILIGIGVAAYAIYSAFGRKTRDPDSNGRNS